PEIPSWLDDLVVQLLEKEPDKRPPDAYVLSRRLQEVLAKVDLNAKDDRATLVEDHLTIEGETPQAAPARPAAGATLMRDLVRSEIERQQTPTAVQAAFNNTWVLVTLLLLMVSGVAWLLMRKPATPEQQFQAGVELMQRPTGEDWLTAKNKY